MIAPNRPGIPAELAEMDAVPTSSIPILAWIIRAAITGLILLSTATGWSAQSNPPQHPPSRPALESLAKTQSAWPTAAALVRVVTLQDYNTRLVVASTALLGVASGLIGSFLMLRKRSLMGDVLSHATLPGIGIAFLIMVAWGGDGKDLSGLLLGASITGLAGVLIVLAIRKTTRLKDDAAMGLVLSVLFGIGVAVLGVVQTMPQGSAAGLESFIYGKAASMVFQDFLLISLSALAIAAACTLLFKQFTLLAFDEDFASSQGLTVYWLDVLMLGLVAAVTVVGLQAVGLILIIAFLITPAAAARFWTHDLRWMLLIAGGIGGLSGWWGASLSGLFPRLPAGAVIVLVAAGIFVFSLLLGPARGVLLRIVLQRRLRRKVGRQHLLRGAFELLEGATAGKQPGLARNAPIAIADLLNRRSWSERDLHRLIRTARNEDHIDSFDGRTLQLSESGFGEAARITRNHRLWELFLIRHADIAPSHADRDADAVEHILDPEMVRELESELARKAGTLFMPPSPHVLREEKI